MTRSRRRPDILTAVSFLGVIAILYFARDVLIPLALAITLALIFSRPVDWLEKVRIPRFAATLLVVTTSLLAVGGIAYVIANQLVGVVNELPAYSENIDRKLTALRSPGSGGLGRAAQNVTQLRNELTPPAEPAAKPQTPLPVRIVEPAPNELVYLRQVAQPFLPVLAKVVIVLVFTVFLLVEAGDVRNRLARLAGLSRLNLMTQTLEDGTRRVSRYLLLQCLVNAVFGVLSGVGLYLIGVPYAALWGTLAALLRIVPYIGSLTAGMMPLVLSLAVSDGWRMPLLVFILFVTLEFITGNLLEPRLYGAHTGISALALLVTTVFWATLWGPVGLILSTPLTVCVVVLGSHVKQLSFLHILLGDQPVLTPDAHLYQRLLAMDDREARIIADQYRNENSLAQLYDAVLIPALTLAEQDRHKDALDTEREEFLFLSVRELVAELGFASRDEEAERLAAEARTPSMPERVICFSANDEADEIANVMLSQLLEQAGCPTIAVPLGSSAMSLLSLIEPTANDIFCISAIQPFAFSHARTVSRELKAKFPGVKTVVGVWGFSGDAEHALLRFQPSPPDRIVRSLAEALEYFGIPLPEAEGKAATPVS